MMNDEQRLYRNGVKVDSLYRAVRDSQAVELIPKLVEQIIADEMWREHLYEKTGETFKFESFQEFIETHPPDGLGTKIDILFKMCLDHPSIMEMIDQTIQSTNEKAQTDKLKIKKPAVSNARQAGLRRLRQYAERDEAVADLRRSVLEGKISINAALVAAGLKKPRLSIPKDINKATAALKRFYTREECQQLVLLMTEET